MTAPALIAYHAGWSAPCRIMAPVVAELARSLAGRAAVELIDVDSPEGRARALASGIGEVPTYVVVEAAGPRAREVSRLVGAHPKGELRRMVEDALAPREDAAPDAGTMGP